MKVYFLSAIPCALTINGAYFGVTDLFERYAELSLRDNLFIQFSPQNAQPIGCFLTENIRFSPPDGFEIYLLPDGIALYAHNFPPRDFTLKIHAQARDKDVLVTLFQQGSLQLSIEQSGNIKVVSLPVALSQAKIRFLHTLIGLETEKKLALYTHNGVCVFYEDVLQYHVDGAELSVVIPLCDRLGRTANCRYTLAEDTCVRTAFSLAQTRTNDGEINEAQIAEELLPFAFFESLLIGADYRAFLADSLQDKADDIRSFLGDFISVTPTENPYVCALTYQKAERLYEINHYETTIADGKIVDIRG